MDEKAQPTRLEFPKGISRLVLIDTIPQKKPLKITYLDNENNLSSTKISIEKKITSKKRGSILTCDSERNGENDNENILRRDAYGIPILKGCKRHKVSFIDKVSKKKIAEQIIILVPGEEKGNRECGCVCIMF